jgi:hypothetical protein
MVFPLRVAGPVTMLKLTGSPELAVALTAKAGSLTALLPNAPKEMVWLALATVKVCSTVVAALKVPFPACVAATVTGPAPVIVTVLPLMVAGPEAMLKLTGSAELAVALTVNGASPKVLPPNAPKVMVCACRTTVRVSDWFPVPPALLAESVTVLVPAAVGVPEMRPLPVLTTNPAGKPVALKLVGTLFAAIW